MIWTRFLYSLLLTCNCYDLVSCGWSLWTDWSTCSLTCDIGIKQRERICDPDTLCDGQSVETKGCLVRLCREDPMWSEWNHWSACSASCGASFRTRTRYCMNTDCEVEEETESEQCIDCIVPTCDGEDSPIDCNFESDCDWSTNEYWKVGKTTTTMETGPQRDNTFKTDCGNFIYLEASNLANNQQSFIETSFQEAPTGRMCFTFHVSMYSEYVNEMGSLSVIVHFETKQMTLWQHTGTLTDNSTDWHPVSVYFDPYNDERFKIQFLAQRGPGRHSDIAIDDVMLTEGECAVPVDGNWTPYSEWSECDATCGFATRQRKRSCSSPVPTLLGKLCDGESSEIQLCRGLPSCPTRGQWGDWLEWTSCDNTCNEGEIQTKTRYCNNPYPELGDYCLFENPIAGFERGLEEVVERPCPFVVDCPVDGNWGEWRDVNTSTCTATCGYGYYLQERFCDDPSPAGSGALCDGLMSERRTTGCNLQYCPVDGKWSTWGDWISDGITCGISRLHRTRDCSNPRTDHNGLTCAKSSEKNTIESFDSFEIEEKESFEVNEANSADGPVRVAYYSPLRWIARNPGVLLERLHWFPDKPQECYRLPNFDLDGFTGNVFGILMWAYFQPPEDGAYKFHVQCGDMCLLYFSTNNDFRNNVVEILYSTQTGSIWLPGGGSETQYLLSSRRYYIEGVYIERRDTEYFKVGFTNDGTYTEVEDLTEAYLHATSGPVFNIKA